MGIAKLKKYGLLHGGDYNPDQWLDRPDILEKDIAFMKEAKVNCVSLGIFSWSSLEPEEGVYKLDWMEQIIDNLYKNGIYTILATPTGALPHWLTLKYEEVLQVQSNRVPNLPGTRHNFCYTSPVMRKKTKEINTLLSKRFGEHPGVILWHISNEMGNNGTDASCHCPLCQDAFRSWLKNKYKTLNALNQAWWTTFWSHTYTDWDQIQSPAPHGEPLLHGLNLDWKRFVSSRLLDFYCMETDAVKQYSSRPATTNMMGTFKPLNYFQFAEKMDIISWDSYPSWHEGPDEIPVAVTAAMEHSLMRSLKKAPFLLMESTPSITNWKENNIQKRPGMHMLSSMQAIAHGSGSVQYFQWRKSRGSFEKFHGAVIGHDGSNTTRTFLEVKEVGKRLADISDSIIDTNNQPEVAIIFDWENWWAIDDAAGPKKNMDYKKTVLSHFQTFWELGIDVDLLDMNQDISSYRLVIAPMLYMLRRPFADAVTRYVEHGGTFVTTYYSGVVDDTDLCYLNGVPGLIKEVLGIETEETDGINQYHPNSISFEGRSYQTKDLCEIVSLKGATALAYYEADYYAGTPAVTKHNFGNGTAYYIASRNEASFHSAFYQKIIEQAGIERNISTDLPYGVTVSKRSDDSASYLFVQNYNAFPVDVFLSADHNYTVLETSAAAANPLKLNSYECIILKEAGNAH